MFKVTTRFFFNRFKTKQPEQNDLVKFAKNPKMFEEFAEMQRLTKD